MSTTVETETAVRDAAVDFLERCARGDVDVAYQRHVGPGFRHHNPYFASDVESLRRGMLESAAERPGKRLEVQRTLHDGDLVAVHSRLHQGEGAPTIAVVHILRFAGAKIVEMWDIAQEQPDAVTNELGMF